MEDYVKYDDEAMGESKESRADSDEEIGECPLIVAEGATVLPSPNREGVNTSLDESNLDRSSPYCSSPTCAKDDVEMVDEGTERSPPREIMSSNKEGPFPSENVTSGDDKEEGELEEGELEDEGGDEPAEEKKSEEGNEREQNKENLKFENNEDATWDKAEAVKEKNRDERKRKHKEFDEDKKKKKKRKHQYSSEEDDAPQKFPHGREKAYDFDTLLKQEMYLVGSGPNLEEDPSLEEDQYRGPPFQAHPQFKGLNDADSYESASGEEWDDNPRRRLKRKRRGSRSPSRKNEAICMFYLQGSCKRGSECPYSHEIAPTRKMELCKFYLMDCCAKKEKCLYMHKDFPCKYFHFGMKCKAGDLCKFSHDPLRDITRNILLKHIELAPKDILGDFPRVSKVNAQIILGVTEAKRKGDPVDSDGLENVLDLEGKGFKYLDRVLKSVRKRKGGDKKGVKDREKDREDKERSPKKSKNREDHRDYEREREREKDGLIGRERERDRPKERDRDRDRNRERGKHRSKGDYPHHMSQKQRDFSQRMDVPHQQGHMDDPRNRDNQGRSSFDPRSSPSGGPNHMDPSMKWYSSDEEGEGPQGFRRGQNYSSHERRNRSSEGPSQGSGFKEPGLLQAQAGLSQPFISSSFSSKSNLDDIDVSYLKNVLNTVQSQSSQNSHPAGVRNHGDEAVRRNSSSSWGQDSKPLKSPLREGRSRVSNTYLDMANDIKEVFYDASDDDISRRVDSLIQSARGRSSDQELREDRSFVGLRDSFQGQNDPSWNQGPNSRREDSMDSRDFGPLTYRGETNDDRGFGRDPRYLRDGIGPWIGKMERGSIESREETGESKYVAKGELEFLEGGRGKEDTDLRLLHSIARGRILPNLAEGIESKVNKPSPESATSVGDRPANSIYDFDLRQLDTRKITLDSEEELGSLPFKVPMHSAKEIDASINPRIPIYYQLILVDIPKPDFSRLKVNPDDPKTMEDPRLRKMLRRNSTEDSPTSPRTSKLESDGGIVSPSFDNLKVSDSDNRDPRRMTSRDPRAESKSLARMDSRGDPRVDPRLASRSDPRSDPRMETRGDPRGMNSRFDPRVDNRDPRMDPRESPMDSDLRESDPRICSTPVFVNGMVDGSNYGHFASMNVVSIDPRGRPGLLGPAPNQSPKNLSIGLPGPIPPNLGANPFLLSQSIPAGGTTSYLPNDRGDMINASGSPFPQGKWGSNRGNFSDPRLGRDADAASFTPSSVS